MPSSVSSLRIVIERNNKAHVGGQEASFLNSKYQLENGCPEYNKIWLANTLLNYSAVRADGHKMLCWEGARMEETMGTLSWGTAGYIGFPYLLVNSRGDRFMNECTSNLNCAHIIAEQPGDNSYIWQILPTNDFDMPTNFGFPIEFIRDVMHYLDGEHYEADTIEELAEKMGVDPEVFCATVARYNELCYNGDDVDYLKAPRYLDAIDDPPYVAWKVPFAFVCTTSGVRCNNKLEVLDSNGYPIPGLYAAGSTVGYRWGTTYQTQVHGGTNMYAMTHGFVAGESAANR